MEIGWGEGENQMKRSTSLLGLESRLSQAKHRSFPFMLGCDGRGLLMDDAWYIFFDEHSQIRFVHIFPDASFNVGSRSNSLPLAERRLVRLVRCVQLPYYISVFRKWTA